MTTFDMSDRLACGASPARLLDQVAEGRPWPTDAHQRSCPHCRTGLVELAVRWAAVRRWATQPVSPPATLAASVMAAVRAVASSRRRVPAAGVRATTAADRRAPWTG
ncbi:MAG: hypothetical protein ACRD0J_02650, partial [Acidimicrobiales bacterium]